MKPNSMDFQKGYHYTYPKAQHIDPKSSQQYNIARYNLICYDGKLHWYFSSDEQSNKMLVSKFQSTTGCIVYKGRIVETNIRSIDWTQLCLVLGFIQQKKLISSITPEFPQNQKYLVTYHMVDQGIQGLQQEYFSDYSKSLDFYNMKGNIPKCLIDEYGGILLSHGNDQYRLQCLGWVIYDKINKDKIKEKNKNKQQK